MWVHQRLSLHRAKSLLHAQRLRALCRRLNNVCRVWKLLSYDLQRSIIQPVTMDRYWMRILMIQFWSTAVLARSRSGFCGWGDSARTQKSGVKLGGTYPKQKKHKAWRKKMMRRRYKQGGLMFHQRCLSAKCIHQSFTVYAVLDHMMRWA